MTDTKNTGDKTLTASPKTLTLKRPSEPGVVRQSFSHGRTNAVVVEKVKRRILTPAEVKAAAAPPPVAAAPRPVAPTPPAAAPRQEAPPAAAAPQAAPRPSASAPAAAPSRPASGSRPSSPGMVLRTLTNDEMGARAQALAGARVREAEDRKRAEIEARARIIREANEERERLAAEARKREEDARRAHEDETRRRAEAEAAKRLGEEAPAERSAPVSTPSAPSPSSSAPPPRRSSPPPSLGAPSRRPSGPETEEPARAPVRRPGGGGPVRPVTPAKPERARVVPTKERSRLTITTATGAGGDERSRSVASYRRRVQRMSGKGSQEPKEKLAREVVVPETITVQELANRMSERAVDVVRLLMKQGVMKKINELIDADTAQLVAEELGHTVRRVAESDVEEGLFDAPDASEVLTTRPPVVTIMG
ncbi:MAG TPA: translation initiation factor IF-2 N-terminal domain-containing protein, partial [Hansschlegelia sp.]